MYAQVNGERNPTEVYNDFRSSVLQILSAHKSAVPVVVPNGVVRSNVGSVLQDDAVGSNNNDATNNVSDPITANNDAQPTTTNPRVIFVVGKW